MVAVIHKKNLRGRLIDFVLHDGETKPVYGIVCNWSAETGDYGDNRHGREVDNIGGFPVYAFARECCPGMASDETIIDVDCFPYQVSSRMTAIIALSDPKPQAQHCGAPECHAFELTHNAGTWSGGSAEFLNGETSISITCDGANWIVTLTGCIETSVEQEGSIDLCGNLILGNTESFAPHLESCCDCSSGGNTVFTYLITAHTPNWQRAARYVDAVMYNDELTAVYAFADCCGLNEAFTFAPRCCARIPCTLYATITSSCPCFDGLQVTLTFSALTSTWGGTANLTDCPTINVGFSCFDAGEFDQETQTGEENPCEGATVGCEEQGFTQCDVVEYLAGNINCGVQCGNASWTSIGSQGGGSLICAVCDCDNLDVTFAMSYGGILDCSCDDTGMSVHITASPSSMAFKSKPRKGCSDCRKRRKVR